MNPEKWPLLALVLAFALSAPAQELRVLPAYVAKTNKVEMLIENTSGSASARDPIRAQDGPNLTVLEDGQAGATLTEFKTFRASNRGMALVIALDVSGTMKGKPLDAMKAGLITFLRETSTQDRLCLVTFADDIQVNVPFGSTSGDMERGIQKLAPRGKITELYKGLYKCMELLRAPGLPERRRLLVITDGKDEGVAYSLEDVLSQAKRQGTPVDTVGITQIDPKYLSICERLSDITGGTYANAQNLGDLDGILRRLSQGFQTSPVAVFTPSLIKLDGADHRIGVRFDKQGTRLSGEAKLSFPREAETKRTPAWKAALKNPFLLGGLLVVFLLAVGLVIYALRRKRARLAAEAAAVATAQGLARLRAEHEARETIRKAEQAAAEVGAQVPEVSVAMRDTSAPRKNRKTAFQSEFRCDAPAPGHPAILLRVETGGALGQVFSVESDPCWIGSEEGAAIRISQDDFMSGFHAYIRWQGGLLYLFDNQSTNGTFKNDQKVGENSVVISPGDRIRTGQTSFSLLQVH